MKPKFLLLGAVAASSLFATVDAKAQLLSYDSFSYASGTLVGRGGGTGFGGAYTASNGGSTTSTPGYTYTDANGNTLQTAGGKADLASNNNGVFRTLSGTFGGGNSTVYVSFLEQVNSTNNYAGFSLFTGTGNEHLFIGSGGGTGLPAVNLNATGPRAGNGGTPLTGLSLLVAQIQFSTTNGVTVTLYDNPVLGIEPIVPYLTLNNANNFSFDTIRIQSGADTGAIDEVRMGNTYADVTPIATVPEPSAWWVCVALIGIAGLVRGRRAAAWLKGASL